MSRTFYSDYTKHALRFYARYSERPERFNTEVDEANWTACDEILKKHSKLQFVMFTEVEIPFRMRFITHRKNITSTRTSFGI